MTMLTKYFFPRNECFAYEILRAATYSNYGGADIGEVIAIASRIRSGNLDDWCREWTKAGDRAFTNAEHSASVGNKLSAHEGFLRAGNYYRTAEFFRRDDADPSKDTVLQHLSERSETAFMAAMEKSPYSCERISIPYEETTLLGYFMSPDPVAGAAVRRRTIVFNGGYDSTAEEAWFAIGAAALARGFNVLAFDGPGQGMTLRRQGLVFRPDWENVLVPVMDYTLARDDVDVDAVAIFGWSMGGYLVARGATVEHRAKVIILDDGIYDFGSAYRKDQPLLVQKLVEWQYDSVANFIFRCVQRLETGIRWGLRNGVWSFGASSEADFLRKVKEYTLEGRCQDIRTPCLILDAVNDHFLKGQPEIFRQHLTCEHEFVSPTVDEGGDTHCHMGAFSRLHQIIFDYLETRLPAGETR